MALSRTIRGRKWPLALIVCTVTAAVWGIYAWQFGSTAPPVDRDESAQEGRATATRGTGADPGATLLRATPRGADPAPRQPGGGTPDGHGAPLTPIDLRPVVNPALPRTTTSANRRASIHATTPGMDIGFGRIRHDSPAAGASLQRGRQALAAGDFFAARDALSAALDRGLARADEAFARRELHRIADALVFSRAVRPEDRLARTHTVGSGDNLWKIAARQRITAEFLGDINRLADPDSILLGAPLKVIEGPFHAVIDKSDHRMDIYLSDVQVRSFRVGLGTNGGTPVGTWLVKDKLRNPEWTDPQNGVRYLADDPHNPIGERWIGLEGIAGEAVGRTGFGIHGTIDPSSIGENMSMGCIRLVAEDIEVVFDLLVETYSRVIIRP